MHVCGLRHLRMCQDIFTHRSFVTDIMDAIQLQVCDLDRNTETANDGDLAHS